MDLKIKDVAEILQVSEKTIYRWIKEKAIPVYHINHQYRFVRAEINDWIRNNRVRVPLQEVSETASDKPVCLKDLIKKGGIYYKIEGKDREECLRSSLSLILFPPDVSRDKALSYLLEREALMSTGIGNGIAFPHSRKILFPRVEDELVSICFLNEPLAFGSLDGVPVHSLIYVFSSSLQHHVEIMAKLAYLCKEESFLRLLSAQAPRGEILNWIDSREKSWLPEK